MLSTRSPTDVLLESVLNRGGVPIHHAAQFVTCDKVVMITVQQLLGGQYVLLHPHTVSRCRLIEQMLLISKHKHDVPKLMTISRGSRTDDD